MEGSAETLATAGTFAVLYGLLLGIPLARARMAAPAASRHLVTTHLEALIGGAVLLGLSLAADYSTLSRPVELTAAWLLAAGVAVSLVGGALNWLLHTGDAFAQRSPGFLLQAASGPLLVAGGALLAVGVVV